MIQCPECDGKKSHAHCGSLLRERLAAVEAERDKLQRSRDAAWAHVAQASDETGVEGEWTLLEQVILLRARADRTDRILSALRRPSEAVIDAAHDEWAVGYGMSSEVSCIIAAIRAAVAAAEQEVQP